MGARATHFCRIENPYSRKASFSHNMTGIYLVSTFHTSSTPFRSATRTLTFVVHSHSQCLRDLRPSPRRRFKKYSNVKFGRNNKGGFGTRPYDYESETPSHWRGSVNEVKNLVFHHFSLLFFLLRSFVALRMTKWRQIASQKGSR